MSVPIAIVGCPVSVQTQSRDNSWRHRAMALQFAAKCSAVRQASAWAVSVGLWAPLVPIGQPIVLYMVMHNLERIAAAMLKAGLAGSTPAAVIVSATTPKQRVLISTLDKLAAEARAQKLEPPAIVVIGEIVPLRDELIGAQTNQAAELK